ncbi:hypothetical protein [Thiohalorhabdus sp.]|uniref:hypothetical protein n=1 Tax=Thiohalorhabdus sp. TaxID=3094134 RepID=UPI002FC298D4
MEDHDEQALRRQLYAIAAELGKGKTIDHLRDGYAALLEEVLEAAQDDIGRSAAESAVRSALTRAGLEG